MARLMCWLSLTINSLYLDDDNNPFVNAPTPGKGKKTRSKPGERHVSFADAVSFDNEGILAFCF
jgi:hypothetical protein